MENVIFGGELHCRRSPSYGQENSGCRSDAAEPEAFRLGCHSVASVRRKRGRASRTCGVWPSRQHSAGRSLSRCLPCRILQIAAFRASSAQPLQALYDAANLAGHRHSRAKSFPFASCRPNHCSRRRMDRGTSQVGQGGIGPAFMLICRQDSAQIASLTRFQALRRWRPSTLESALPSRASSATIISSCSAMAAAHFSTPS